MKRVFLALATIVMLVTASSCGHDQGFQPSDVIKNENIIKSESFCLHSGLTEEGTLARGAVFFSGKGSVADHAQIIAYIEINPDEQDGVIFTIPVGWKISVITGSYPEEETPQKAADFIEIFYTGSTQYGYNEYIEIGANRSLSVTKGVAGSGTIIIELDAIEETPSETVSITIWVGDAEKVIEVPVS